MFLKNTILLENLQQRHPVSQNFSKNLGPHEDFMAPDGNMKRVPF